MKDIEMTKNKSEIITNGTDSLRKITKYQYQDSPLHKTSIKEKDIETLKKSKTNVSKGSIQRAKFGEDGQNRPSICVKSIKMDNEEEITLRDNISNLIPEENEDEHNYKSNPEETSFNPLSCEVGSPIPKNHNLKFLMNKPKRQKSRTKMDKMKSITK